MKKTFFRLCALFLFLFVIQLNIHGSSHKHHKKVKKESLRDLVKHINKTVDKIDMKEKSEYLITARDIGKNGFVINKPGSYCLAEDIVFNPSTPPSGSFVAAITINSSNVVLNLNNHRLSLYGVNSDGSVPPSQTPFVIGIYIPDTIPTSDEVNAVGLESIYINGDRAIIDGFSMYGIRVLAHTYDIQISNLTIKNCGKLASLANRNVNPALANYYPSNYPFAASSLPLFFGVGGLFIGESDQMGMGPVMFTQKSGVAQNRIRSLVLENVSCLDNYFAGLYMENSTDAVINNCHFDDTFIDDPLNLFVQGGSFGGGAEIDYEYPAAVNLVVKNTSCNNTQVVWDFRQGPGVGTSPYGGFCAIANNVLFENCQFNNTSSTAPDTYCLGFGSFCLQNGTFVNCSFDGTQSLSGPVGTTAAYGCYIGELVPPDNPYEPILPSDNIKMIGCTANNIQQNGQLVLDVNGNPAPELSNGNLVFGFRIIGKNIYLENCTACDILCNGPATVNSIAAGFYLGSGEIASPDQPEWVSENLEVKGCIASRITTVQGGNAIGFFMKNAEIFNTSILGTISFENCVAEGNQALIPDLMGVFQGAGIGFFYNLQVGGSSGYPISYTNCKALHNRGANTIANNGSLDTLYTAGFFSSSTDINTPLLNHTYYGCEAAHNIYGFLLANCSLFSIRECRADYNVDDSGLVGSGFVDLGSAGILSSPGKSTSLFETNHAFVNGPGTIPTGLNGNYNINYPFTPFTLNGSLTTGFPASGTFQPVNNISIVK